MIKFHVFASLINCPIKLETKRAKAWYILTASLYYRGRNQLQRNRSFWLWWTRFHRGRNADSTAANAQVVLSGTVDNFYSSPTLAEIFGHTESKQKRCPCDDEVGQNQTGRMLLCKKGPLLALSWKEKKSQKNPSYFNNRESRSTIPEAMVR